MSVTDIHFMATVQGHYRYLEADTEEERRNYASTAHYYDYRLVGPDGNIDGRQGIRLGMEGVVLLEVFQPKKRERKPVTTTEEMIKEEKKPTDYTTGRMYKKTKVRVDAVAARLGYTHVGYHDTTINALVDAFERGGTGETAVAETPAPVDVASVVCQILSADATYQKLVQEKETAHAAQLLKEALKTEASLVPFLIDALIKKAKFEAGVEQRHAGKDFSSMKTSELAGIRHKGAANERIRRAVAAIAAYNDQAQSANDRWFVNPRAIQRLAGSRYPIINEYFAAHQAEIDALNKKYQLNDRYNHKPDGIETVITIPEEA